MSKLSGQTINRFTILNLLFSTFFVLFLSLKADSACELTIRENELLCNKATVSVELKNKLGQGRRKMVYIVHGTFASNSPWHLPGGDFFESLLNGAKYLETDVFFLKSFQWSGKFSAAERLVAGRNFACKLEKTWRKNPDLDMELIGHSHGSNVIILAADFLAALNMPEKDRSQMLDRMAYSVWLEDQEMAKCRGCLDDLKQELQEACKSPAKECASIKSIKPGESEIIVNDESLDGIKTTCRQLFASLEQSLPVMRSGVKTAYQIDKAYFIAAPVCVKHYKPDFSIIKKAYNLYSQGDLVQPVAGLYERVFPLSQNLINAEIVFSPVLASGTIMDITYPSHSELRSFWIGQYLFQIPHLIESLNLDWAKTPSVDVEFYSDNRTPKVYVRPENTCVLKPELIFHNLIDIFRQQS